METKTAPKKFELDRVGDQLYVVKLGGEQVGMVYAVPVPNRSYEHWQFTGNPYPYATYRSAYAAARKLIERLDRVGRARGCVAALNGQPLGK
jgi:hypothetical protein